jgi:hypothetical protein
VAILSCAAASCKPNAASSIAQPAKVETIKRLFCTCELPDQIRISAYDESISMIGS